MKTALLRSSTSSADQRVSSQLSTISRAETNAAADADTSMARRVEQPPLSRKNNLNLLTRSNFYHLLGTCGTPTA